MLNNHSQQSPVLVGHRGFPAKYPENTLAGFRAALAAGATAIECDIQFSHDGRPMVIHDPTLKRTTGQAGRVVDFTAEQLQGVSAHEPKRLGEVGAPESIPRLSELVELLQEFTDATLFVEIKHESFAWFDRQYCVDKIMADVQALGARAIIISFDAKVLQVARQYGLAIGWVIKRYSDRTQQQAVALSPEFLIADYKKLPAAPAEPWAGNWQWFIYDLVDAPLAKTFVERGVRYIETWDIESLLSAREFQETGSLKVKMSEFHQDRPVADNAFYDVIVIGAGIHGAGIAQAAAARGWKVLVLEKDQVASGTSSKSSKLIHGGLRYLETFQLRLVYESLRERHLLLRNAPELVQLRAFHIPVYRSSSRHPLWIRLGLMLYALLGGLGRNTRFKTIPQRQWAQLDGLNTEGLVRVFQYRDAQTDDAALTRAVLASAQSLGVEVRCDTEVIGALRQQDHYQVALATGGEPLRCRALINAAGPWVNRLAARVDPQPSQIAVDLVQGVHIVLDFEAPGACYYLESQDDGRAVFALPWQGKVMVGTTEKHCTDAPERCQPSDEEIAYLLRVFNHYFPEHGATTQHIVATMAGLRVLPQATQDAPVFSKMPRDTQFVLEGKSPVYLAVYGGKLTCYRSTAEKAVRKLVPFMPRRKVRESTRKLMLKPTSTN